MHSFNYALKYRKNSKERKGKRLRNLKNTRLYIVKNYQTNNEITRKTDKLTIGTV